MPDNPATSEQASRLIFHRAAQVRVLDPAALDAELRANVVLDPSVLEGHDPFFWTARISTDEVDAYFTRMHETTLRNFATEAQRGVSFQNSHRVTELPLGRSLAGRFLQKEGEGFSSVEADFYTLRNLNLNGLQTDQLIDGMRAGIVRDVSVGFYGGEFRCSVCGRDMIWDWECHHWPGVEYAIMDDDGNETSRAVAVAWIVGSHLSETSAVYDGACPSAAILKVQERMASGGIDARTLELLEQRYRISVRKPARQHPSAPPGDSEQREATTVPEGQTPSTNAPSAEELQVRTAADLAAMQRRFTDFRVRIAAHGYDPSGADDPLEWAASRLDSQRQAVSDGETYRRDLVDDAIKAGVAAIGNGFAADSYRNLLATASLDTVKRMRDDWQAIADKELPAGRQTGDGVEREPRQNGRVVHDRAYQS